MILMPLHDKTAISVAKAIMENVFLRFGAGELLTDNGCEFRNDLLSEICRLMGVAQQPMKPGLMEHVRGAMLQSTPCYPNACQKIKEIGRKI